MMETIYETLAKMRVKYEDWLNELSGHVKGCPLCCSISEDSTAHRSARLG